MERWSVGALTAASCCQTVSDGRWDAGGTVLPDGCRWDICRTVGDTTRGASVRVAAVGAISNRESRRMGFEMAGRRRLVRVIGGWRMAFVVRIFVCCLCFQLQMTCNANNDASV